MVGAGALLLLLFGLGLRCDSPFGTALCLDAINRGFAEAAAGRRAELQTCLVDWRDGVLDADAFAQCIDPPPEAWGLGGAPEACHALPDGGDERSESARHQAASLERALLGDLLGAEPAAALVHASDGAAAAHCQAELLAQVAACSAARIQGFNVCKRAELEALDPVAFARDARKGKKSVSAKKVRKAKASNKQAAKKQRKVGKGKQPKLKKGKRAKPSKRGKSAKKGARPLTGADLARVAVCRGADPEGAVARHCGAAIEERIAQACIGVETEPLFPGCRGEALAPCLAERVATRVDVALDATDQLSEVRVLVFTRTEGFRHPSIQQAWEVLGNLPPEERLHVVLTEDPATFSDAGLAPFDVLLFANTTGDVLDDEQQRAMERFVRSGRGYVGVHSAADTEYDWPWYGQLVGAYFRNHPLLPVEVEVTTEDPLHPATQHLEERFLFVDEIYNFDRNPRADHAILLTVDEEGFIFPNFPPGPSMGDDHPIAWHKEFEGARSFYTNLGHRPETWSDPRFLEHLLAAIRWVAEGASYSRVVVSDEARNPLALAVTPQGDVYYVERTGELMHWNAETGRLQQALQLAVDLDGENGLLGVALEPDFRRRPFVYLYHSEPVPEPRPAVGPPGENVLSRFRARRDGRLDPRSRVDLLRVPSERTCCHDAGSLAFAPDGTLFLSTGDNTNPFGEAAGFAPLDGRPGREIYDARRTAPNPFDLRGKILRIRPDGSVPPGNLFPASGRLGRPEIFAQGTRNPFRIAVDPMTGRLFWGDVGPDAPIDSPIGRGPRGYDEINFADTPGDYGWPFCIGANRPYAEFDYATRAVGAPYDCSGRRPALLAYDYFTISELALGNARNNPEIPFTGRTAIAGAFYRRPPGAAPFALPRPYRDALLMAEWTRDILAAVHVEPDGELGQVVRLLPWERFKRPIDIEVAPDGALYVLEFGSAFSGDNPDARLSRIEHAERGGLRPVARIEAAPGGGAAPLRVALSGERSSAAGPRQRVAGYAWDVDGDGRVDSRAPSLEYVFDSEGVFPVTLVVTDRAGKRSVPALRRIVVGNTPPEVRILSPEGDIVVPSGSQVEIVASATDAEDGALPCDDLIWERRLGHNAHAHPSFAPAEGCTLRFNSTLPDHGDSRGLFWVVEARIEDRGTPPLSGSASIRIDVE